MEAILRTESLRKVFRGSRFQAKREPVVALKEVSLAVKRGQTLGVVGESGSGKSTLGRIVIGLETQDSGQVWFDGDDLGKGDRRSRLAKRRKMQIVFQDPYASLNPRIRVGHALSEALDIHTRMSRRARTDRAKEYLERVGLSAEDYSKFPHQFSGGQRQRVCIARALIVEPSLVVCDEAVSALDVSVQATILDLLAQLQEDLGLTYVFISHDLGVVKNISDEVMVMKSGEVVERGTAQQLFDSPTSAYTKELLAAAPIVDPRSERFRRHS